MAEEIVQDLFTEVLDWSLEDVVLQVGRADVILTDLGLKRLVLEVKRPGALRWNRAAVHAALDQACRYAAEQRVGAVAVSDGTMLYAADVVSGGLRDRAYVHLDTPEPPLSLWWMSLHGIYRPCPPLHGEASLPVEPIAAVVTSPQERGELRHHRYHLPARCFAYVGSASDTRTWKLPYLHEDASPDAGRLRAALGSIVSNYRGTKVVIPREAVPEVLVRLAIAARDLRKLPCQSPTAAATYVEAHEALVQLARLGDVGCCAQEPDLDRRAIRG